MKAITAGMCSLRMYQVFRLRSIRQLYGIQPQQGVLFGEVTFAGVWQKG
jgi:hypothetical protein